MSKPLSFVGIIPARYASTRFPGKPLADIGGKPMIQLVYERASSVLPTVCVATDDRRIYDVVRAFGGRVVMTSPEHRSGTDRCHEAYTLMGEPYEVIVNIQGDEPFVHPSQIETLQACFADPHTQIATLARPLTGRHADALADPNTVKVVMDNQGRALYFSRSPIPYLRGADPAEWTKRHTYYKHIGIYAYRSELLQEITTMPRSPLEIAESLEQLRWIENGLHIKVGLTEIETVGVDTPADLERARAFLQRETRAGDS